MYVQINTDRNIEGDGKLTQKVEATVKEALDRFQGQITRVEVHLCDENSESKFGANDKCCLLEVRLMDHRPTATGHKAPTLEQAVDGAAKEMKRLLVSTLSRLDNRS